MLIKKIAISLFLCMLVVCTNAQDSLLLRDFKFVSQSDPWLTHRNAAALTRFSANNIVKTEVSVDKGNGGLVDYSDSRNTLAADGNVESFYRLGSRVVTYGTISYTGWSGRDMTGSAFMQERLPFNLVEDSLTNPGKKHRDTYHLIGALGVDVHQGISVGARMDYTSSNYAKYKDLRHQNKLMDMKLTLGGFLPLLKGLSIGADYTYHRQTESVAFGTYGKSERVYKTLIDYGAFMGRVEQFGNEGYTDKAREMPLFEESHGASIQTEVIPTDRLSFFGSFIFSSGDGYYGRKSPYTATYTQHKRNITETNFTVTYQPLSHTSRFCLDISYQTEKLSNRAETFRELTNTSGANYYEYYDAVETGTKKWNDIAIGLTTQQGIRGELPGWELAAIYQCNQRQQSAFLYPFYRYQSLKINRLMLCAAHNLIGQKGVWTFSLKTAYQNGSGAPFQDGTFVEPSQKQEAPATMDAFLFREYRYLTAKHYLVGGSVQYAFVFPRTRLKTHARLAFDYHTTNQENVYTQGNDHTHVTLAVGCTL